MHINTALAFAADAFILSLRVKSHDMEMQLVTYRFTETENWSSLLIGVHFSVFTFGKCSPLENQSYIVVLRLFRYYSIVIVKYI